MGVAGAMTCCTVAKQTSQVELPACVQTKVCNGMLARQVFLQDQLENFQDANHLIGAVHMLSMLAAAPTGLYCTPSVLAHAVGPTAPLPWYAAA